MVNFLLQARKNFFLLLMTLLCGGFLSVAAAAPEEKPVTTSAPHALDIYGKLIDVPLHSGKWVVINYWAAWCGACVMEIPELNKFAQAIEHKPVIFIAVNYDQLPADEQKVFAKKYDVSYTMLKSNPFGSLISMDGITTLPVTYVISPKGDIQELNGSQSLQDLLSMVG